MTIQQDLENWLETGGPKPASLLGVKLNLKATLRKFDGDGAFDPNATPVETLISEDTVVIGGQNATAD